MATYLGIEVTTEHVKGVVLRTAYRKLQIDVAHRVPRRAPGADGITTGVRELLEEIGVEVDAAYAALPGAEVSLRPLELPRAVYRRGGRVVATELEGSLPFDIDSAIVDAQVVKQRDTMSLLAVAVRTERVRSFVTAIAAGGIDPREVGAGPVALGDLATAIPELAVPGPVLLLHAYETQADLTVLVDGIVQTARTLTGQTTHAARARDVRQTLSAYLAAGGEPPVVAYLFGETNGTYVDVVADALGVSVDAVKFGLPLGPILVSPVVDPSMVQMCPLALAMALHGAGVGRRIDLRKGDLAVGGGAQVLRDKGWFLAACMSAIVMSWGAATFMRYQSVKAERDRLITSLGRVSLDVFGERVTDPQRAKALALGTNSDAEQDPVPQADAYDVIGALSARIPESVRHDVTALDVTDEHVQIQGLVDTLADRDRVVEALSQYECFQNIQAGRAQRNPGDNRQQYTIDLELRCPERQGAPRRPGSGGSGGTRSTTGGSGGTST